MGRTCVVEACGSEYYPDCGLSFHRAFEMKDVPKCLQRSHQGLDGLINDINAAAVITPMVKDCACGCSTYRGIQLMCDLWKILKDPNLELYEKVQMKVDTNKTERSEKESVPNSRPSKSCHGACRCSHKTVGDSSSSQKKRCCQKTDQSSSDGPHAGGMMGSLGTSGSTIGTYLKDNVASFEKVCLEKVDNLLQTEDQLRDALKKLEQREKKGTELLKKADHMWVCMEEAYKQKLNESSERQVSLERELKNLETSTKKWRKNMKDLESEVNKINKVDQEIKEKIIQKNGDVKSLDLEIADLKKRMENCKSEVDATKKSYSRKKEASDKKIANLEKEVQNLEKTLVEENKKKREKELEGTKFIKEAREDFKKVSGVLLKKKLENEDMKAEKEAILSDIEVLMQLRDTCKDRCELKERSLDEDIKNIDREIVKHEQRCDKCNKCTDTSAFHRFCTDCPQCADERRCFIEGDHCRACVDCVCTAIKKKFLDNVFENMYTVLERLVYKGRGKIVADQVLECLQRSKNAKLDAKTRKSLQAFILSGVKKQLNLTIVGGAVKTRCEMEPETYKQLMSCLQKVKVSTQPKEDKGTISKKEACMRWGGANECHCPSGPKACICISKAPPPPNDPTSCPEDDEDDQKDNEDSCPHGHNLICDCEEVGLDQDVDNELSESKPKPCKGSTCKFTKNTRTAPCVLRSDDSLGSTKRDACSSSIPIKIVPSAKKKEYCDCLMADVSSSSCAGTKVIKLDTHITNFIKSSTGDLVIALKKDFLEGIQKEINQNSSSKIVIKGTNSGCLLLQLTPDKNEFDVDRTMVLKNVLSGCIYFKGNRNVLKLITEVTSGLSEDNGYCCNRSDKLQPNAILRETPSGVALVIPVEPLKLIKENHLAFDRSTKRYSMVKILSLDDTIIEFPGVLKSTSSHNYILNVDKEFEKNFQETVKNVIGDDTAIAATIRKSVSDSYLVKLECPKTAPDTNVAILNKTRSGNIKVTVDDSNSRNLEARLSDSPEAKNLTKCVINLLKKLNDKNTYHITICQKTPMRYKRIDYETSNKTKNASEHRKAERVPLNEKSRGIFTDRLRKYLTDRSKSLHLEKTTSDSPIFLIKRGSSNNSVVIKITSSMDIYLLTNEQNNKKNILVQCSLINLLNGDKFAKTRINTKLMTSGCYFASRDTLETLKSLSDSSDVHGKARQHVVFEKQLVPNDYPVSPLPGTDSTESGKVMQHIVIKPAPKLSCIYHTDTYNASSLDDLPCTSDNNKIRGNALKTGRLEINSAWDSLSFLPPQLPSFLDVKHLYS